MPVEIRETPIGGKIKDFLGVVDHIYRDDPRYVRPLNMEIGDRLSKKNPFFEHGEAVMFTAYRSGLCVGRCTASIDREHLARYKDDTGFFGFIDTINDQDVATSLLDNARRWLADRGMKRVRGPMSLCINEEIGCLVEGFDTPPMIMMAHHRAYQGERIEGAGFKQLKDLFAWRYDIGSVPRRARKAFQDVESMPEVRTRTVDMKNLEGDVRTIMDIYNDAWSENWGFVPLTEKELAKMASDMKLILMPKLAYITEIDGEAAAVALALPNINAMIGDLNGSLFPTGIAKLLYRLKIKGPDEARLIILGIRKKYRHVRKYAALSAYLYVKMNDAAAALGIKWGELSWTLEDNGPVNVGIKLMGGKIYKRYRIYEREI